MRTLLVLAAASILSLSLATSVQASDLTVQIVCSSGMKECNNIGDTEQQMYPNTRGVLPVIAMETSELPDEIIHSLPLEEVIETGEIKVIETEESDNTDELEDK